MRHLNMYRPKLPAICKARTAKLQRAGERGHETEMLPSSVSRQTGSAGGCEARNTHARQKIRDIECVQVLGFEVSLHHAFSPYLEPRWDIPRLACPRFQEPDRLQHWWIACGLLVG